MKTEEETYWQIQDLLKGRLDESEASSFQRQVEEDVALVEEVEKHRLANRLIIQNRLKAAEQVAIKTREDYKKKLLYRKFSLITGLVLMAAVGGYLWLSSLKTSQNAAPVSQSETKVVDVNERATTTVQDKKSQEEELPKAVQATHSVKVFPETVSGSKPTPTVSESQESGVAKQEPEVTVATVEKPKEGVPVPLPVPHKEEVVLPQNACSGVQLNASVFATPSCKGEHGGSIAISQIKGGKSPYHTEIRNEKGAMMEEVNALPKGVYSAIVIDDHHCQTRIDHIEVKERVCEEPERVFNPFLDETFELPSSSKNGTFVVYEKNGNVYFKKEMLAHQREEWNGLSNNGGMETGHFTYEIIYQDGTRKQGTLTITR